MRADLNQYGQTYGSLTNATSPETEPDLIAATGVDGTNGYVKRTEVEEFDRKVEADKEVSD
ncbi:hypothetical protein L9W92_16125 [Pelotomaculum terephthalicicum JT]|uniref:hypothetical protein n=1 Tax=Pelotomaculum TaxID=191373 RepID=UPI001F045518|nr:MULTISPECIES: hypothetical protein [Pelotomaculum]MCG9969531.1 hypothetical protein [Pelotomaculum terephthalicicum JT]